MIVISNASPIINLAAIKQLNLLEKLYGKIIIPKGVYQEITDSGEQEPGSKEVQTLDWIETVYVENQNLITSLKLELDKGESETIALAIQLKADLVLMDERKGRLVASRFGLKFIGLLGVIIEAKHNGLIPKARPLLDELITKAGFWIDKNLYNHILQTTGE